MNEVRIFGFEPVYSPDALLLICGSMPSVVSLEKEFYYGHPRNAFWRIISEVFNEAMPETVEEKKQLLLRHQIALWDTIASCERKGSLDSAIKNVEVNDFEQLFKQCPQIRAILFNGASAMQVYHRYVQKEDPCRRHYKLPSTSPAYTMPYSEKKAQWEMTIKEVLSYESL